LTLAVDITRFMAPERFAALLGEHLRAIRGSAPAPGVARIYLPGEIEARAELLAAQRGVEVDEEVCRALNELLERQGLPQRLKPGQVPG
jgi:LDH2 family malate/lactate/ureidoglycolate dehydrogenase